MAKFQLKIDVEPKEIPYLDNYHKRDCADAINRAVNRTFKYTLLFAAASAGYYALYTLFGFTYFLRMQKPLPNINSFIPILAIIIFFFEFVSGTMKKWAIFLQLLFNIIITVVSVMEFQSMIIFPFAVYSIYLHANLMGMLPHYEVISKLKGYPDFVEFSAGDVMEKRSDEDEQTSEEEKPAVTEEKVPEEEKTAVTEEKIPEEEKPAVTEEKIPEKEEKPAVAEEKIPEKEEKPVINEEKAPDAVSDGQRPAKRSGRSGRKKKKH